jgi:hypothetical protein
LPAQGRRKPPLVCDKWRKEWVERSPVPRFSAGAHYHFVATENHSQLLQPHISTPAFPFPSTFHRFSAFPYAILMEFAISRFNLKLIP